MAPCLLWIFLHGGMCTVREACVLHVDYLPTLTATQQAQHTQHATRTLFTYNTHPPPDPADASTRLERGPAAFATVWLRYRLMSRSCMALRPGWPARAELGLVRPPRLPGPRPRRANHPFAGLLGEPVICVLCVLDCVLCVLHHTWRPHGPSLTIYACAQYHSTAQHCQEYLSK